MNLFVFEDVIASRYLQKRMDAMAVNQNGGGLTLEGRKASIPIRSIKIPGQPIPTIVLQTRPTLPSWLRGGGGTVETLRPSFSGRGEAITNRTSVPPRED